MLIIEIGLWNKKYESWCDYSFIRIATRSVLKVLKEHSPPISIERFLVGLERFTEAEIMTKGIVVNKDKQIRVRDVWEIKLPFTVRKVPTPILQATN